MKIYELHKEQFLPIGIEEAWKFFSTAANLEEITPADMSFRILTELNGEPIYSGMIIDYIVKPLLGIPMRWTTQITGVNAPFSFSDKQIKGPYNLWEHKHTFKTVRGGVIMTDVVRYSLPMGFLGELVYHLIVKKKLKGIFDYRENKLKILFTV
jgi:ligand-binding SRPBCC domain-containing protein